MKNILVFAPSKQRQREISLYAQSRDCNLIFDQKIESLLAQAIFLVQSGKQDALQSLFDSFLSTYQDMSIDGIVNCADYFVAAIMSIAAQKLQLTAPSPQAVFTCCDQYSVRMYQKKCIPETVNNFAGISYTSNNNINPPFEFPFLMRPILSKDSFGQEIYNQEEFLQFMQTAGVSKEIFIFFSYLGQTYASRKNDGELFIVESYVIGDRYILEGFVYQKKCVCLGLIDVLPLDNVMPHMKYEYPSSLPKGIQIRMENIARQIMSSLSFDNGFFTIEFIYDTHKDWIGIVYINPQITFEFADLYERVDGINTYALLLDMALGKEPRVLHKRGSFALAARCVLSVDKNCYVTQVPSEESLQKLIARFPDVRIDVLVSPGFNIAHSWPVKKYNYGAINLGAHDHVDLLNRFNVCCSLLDFRLMPA